MSSRARRAVGHLLVIALVVGSCGGDSDAEDQSSGQSGGTTGDSTPVTTAPTTQVTTAPSTQVTTAPSTQVTTAPTGARPSESGSGDECQDLADFMLGIFEVFTGDTSAIDQLFATANIPGELGGDVEIIESAVLQWDSDLKAVGADLSDAGAVASLTPTQLEQVDEAYSALQLATVDALDTVGAYGETECAGFEPSG